MSDAETTVHLLGKSVGYGVLIGVGAAFALAVVIATRLIARYLNENNNSTETFMVSNRTVGIGLTTSAIFSSWFWATELLWTVTMTQFYGVSVGFYYYWGLIVPVSIMGVLGIEAKRKVPKGHTCLEVVELRYGKAAHILYMCFCLANNLLSCAAMILGAAGAISIIADNLSIVASSLLIPFGVLCYTFSGGLRATFLGDWGHSVIAIIVLLYVNTAALVKIGSIDKLYELIFTGPNEGTIEGNYDGSLMTFRSQGAVFFGIIHLLGDMGLTVLDSSFYQKAFSANLKSGVPSYMIGGVCIMAITWPLGTIIGMATTFLENDPSFPTYPRKMTTFEIESGFGLPYTLKALLGDGACGAILLVIYLACTSTVSAQMISVSSILSFDVYKTYINPQAKNKQMIRASHITVVFFSFFAAGFAIMLHYVGANMTWVGYFYPILICNPVCPMILLFTWDRQTKFAFIASPIIGIGASVGVWLGTAYHYYGEITMETTSRQLPCLWAGLTALFLPLVLTVTFSLFQKEHFDWNVFKKAELIEMEGSEASSPSEVDVVYESGSVSSPTEDSEKRSVDKSENVQLQETELGVSSGDEYDEEEQKLIKRYIKIAYAWCILVVLVTSVLFPMSLYRNWIISLSFFRGYTGLSMFWLYGVFLVIAVYPLYDGRHSLGRIGQGLWKDFKRIFKSKR
ncbi:Urea and polyamines transporter [Komagataella phaffii CBS 7435]|uniref:Plasma membrane transporter for both urea and polyamines, expression is highly sensitive to nitrogen n=2 Tax=Komagataella phaffii TaxID=460519 RepID=C4R3B8_KOMPG|nr:uncharacterized protein PAS_chr3_0024 [Komagataella phaffii GS115]AOA64149.1 GQ67_03035T0 [Komagataella phaffii]CAH2450328.1 Urea and polyamines transporter [Komagataella phaffii CBS 7435]AOA68440.1 GQ68_03020T0 [Komagataella phaffii GS115]CAY69953.1 Plasma membrane transporter for both urea and polyamines, expression is highly sensitive to nitrogen [Komagataella phaffii GS115]CCA40158.1 Urea and polyamines transporter [Komagataella phaffii CBS 7435]